MERFGGSGAYPLANELYDLVNDPDERVNVSGDEACRQAEEELAGRLGSYFARFADPRFDLWRGGTVKSNTSRPWLWKDAWGDDWRPTT